MNPLGGGYLEDLLARAVAEICARLEHSKGAKPVASGIWSEGAIAVKDVPKEWGFSTATLWKLMNAGDLPWSLPPHTRNRLVPKKWFRLQVEAHANKR
jgi:hypothetical protein